MTRFAKLVDRVIMNMLTKFAHWFQRLTGRTSIFLAKTSILLTLIASTLMILGLVVPIFPYKISPVGAFIVGLVAIMEIKQMSNLDDAENTFFSSTERVKHSWMSSDFGTRMVWLALSIYRILELCFDRYPVNIWRVFVVVFVYFGIYFYYCFIDINPLPPCRSKLLNFVESFSLKPSIAPSEK